VRFHILVAAAIAATLSQVDRLPDPLTLAGALLISLPIAITARWIDVVTTGGAIVGLACAVLIYSGAYLGGICVLGVALVVTIAATAAGRLRRRAHVTPQHESERRGARNVLANCLIGSLAAFLSEWSRAWNGELATLMFITAIAAGASDTAASEIGKAFGGPPRSFPTLRRVRPGTPGAVTVLGTLAGIAAAAFIAWPGVVLWLTTWRRVPLIVVSCSIGAFVESTLATALEAKQRIDSDELNLINTATAAVLVAILA
jgi:uncharacterized protein (TIGR00297 family)